METARYAAQTIVRLKLATYMCQAIGGIPDTRSSGVSSLSRIRGGNKGMWLNFGFLVAIAPSAPHYKPGVRCCVL